MEEKKQLDFNRPLISVRRPTQQTSETESKTRSSDSVTNNKKKNMPPPSPPVYKSDIKSGPVRNPGTVPFQWEHKPGKPKEDENKPDLQCFVEPHFVPKLPPGRIINGRDREANHQTKTNVDTYHVEDAKSYSSRNVSGLDSPGILVEPFGTLSSDRQTQDLMMGRFLPAAKAWTSETTPPHLARKPPKPEEPMRQVTKKEKQNKVERNPYRFHHSPDQQEEDGNRSSIMAYGVCGLLPQICMRSSFGVLNPVPSARMQAQRAVSVRRMRSKYQDSMNETVNEDKRKQKLNGSVAQETALQVSSSPEGKEKLESFSTSATSRPKISKNFGELLASEDTAWNSSSEAPVEEKTLYVDTVHSVDKKVQEESKEQSISKEYPSLDVVPVKDVQKLIGACEEEEAISPPKSSTEEMNAKRDEEFIEFSSRKVEECPDQDIVADIITKEKKIDLEVQVQRNTTNLESSRVQHRSSYHIVPPPPLPKAPSDSWLKRTLPTIPSKNNSFTWLQSLGSDDNHFTKTQANPKWETMVKTSNTQQGFVCFSKVSKETLNPIPEA
ncbi:unnamed protein product [Arabis nemorensis]|uniref:Uncharacterized protein n=1 Tax=Arabis nemorensis TaxID=586526 RepID=A0A565C1U1_9BRAS|nr:unnamed protein product [Arabis nemorensis]